LITNLIVTCIITISETGEPLQYAVLFSVKHLYDFLFTCCFGL